MISTEEAKFGFWVIGVFALLVLIQFKHNGGLHVEVATWSGGQSVYSTWDMADNHCDREHVTHYAEIRRPE